MFSWANMERWSNEDHWNFFLPPSCRAVEREIFTEGNACTSLNKEKGIIRACNGKARGSLDLAKNLSIFLLNLTVHQKALRV